MSKSDKHFDALSVLAGHKRYAHITGLRNDGVLPELLGLKKIVSEDAVRRGFKAIGTDEGRDWLQSHLDYCTAPLLAEPWIFDADSTVKPLYGHQEGAVIGYNPKKPGRPSHVYHTYTIAGLRLVLDVEVSPGNEHASKYAAPGLWALIDRIPRDCWPAFLRGDSGFGTETIMREAEQRELHYLLKQMTLSFVEIGPGADAYEYGVLVTSLDEEILTLAQCRDACLIAANKKRTVTAPTVKTPSTNSKTSGAGRDLPPATCRAASSWPASSR